MIGRRTFIAASVCSIVVARSHVEAQVQGKIYRIGYLGQGSKSTEFADGEALPALLRDLRALGYVEGRNMSVDMRFADGRPELLGVRASQLVKAKPDVIAVTSVGLAEILLGYTRTIPVVAINAGQLQAEPSVRSLARPGGNLTGMQIFSPETMGKRLQLLQEVVPGLRRVAVLRGVPYIGPGFELYRDSTAAAAAKLGIRVRFLQFDTIDDLNRLFEDMTRQQDQALLIWGNPHLRGYGKEIVELSVKHRLPAIADVRIHPSLLIVYGAKLADVRREAATYVDRILKGANPGDLPIGQPRTFELIINTTTAKAIDLAIPQSLLLRADQVVQ